MNRWLIIWSGGYDEPEAWVFVDRAEADKRFEEYRQELRENDTLTMFDLSDISDTWKSPRVERTTSWAQTS